MLSRRYTYTASQVAEDLAMLWRREKDLLASDADVVEEVRACPELRVKADVAVALAKLEAAEREVLVAATIATRDEVATWLVEAHLWRIFGAFERLLLLAEVPETLSFYEWANKTPKDERESAISTYNASRAAYVAAGRAWEHMREVSP